MKLTSSEMTHIAYSNLPQTTKNKICFENEKTTLLEMTDKCNDGFILNEINYIVRQIIGNLDRLNHISLMVHDLYDKEEIDNHSEPGKEV